MKKILTATVAALTVAGAVASAATPVEAQSYRGGRGHYDRHYDRHRDRDNTGAAVAAGVVGLALGAALASGSNNRSSSYYNNGYYNNGYYNNGYAGSGYYRAPPPPPRYAYYDDYRPRVCVSRDRVYDPYIGRRVTVTREYRC